MTSLPAPDTAKFPAPLPADGVRTLPAGTIFGRIYESGGAHPTRWHEFRHFGPTSSRFDHHPEPPQTHENYAVTYVTPQVTVPPATVAQRVLLVCLSECFSDRGVIERGGHASRATRPRFVLLESTRELRLVDLVDSTWITAAGGNASINTGDRAQARPWARAIHHSYTHVDGVFYRPRTIAQRTGLADARAVALWERAEDAVPAHPTVDIELSNPGLTTTLETFARELGIGLA